MLESLFNKVAGLKAATLLKADSNAGVFLWIFKNTFFTEHLRATAFVAFSKTLRERSIKISPVEQIN